MQWIYLAVTSVLGCSLVSAIVGNRYQDVPWLAMWTTQFLLLTVCEAIASAGDKIAKAIRETKKDEVTRA